jgi:hypothetical protein
MTGEAGMRSTAFLAGAVLPAKLTGAAMTTFSAASFRAHR